MRPIIFQHIADMNDARFDDETRAACAEKVYVDYGVEGLVTLWSCQDYSSANSTNNSVAELGMTLATQWWLQEHNRHAKMVRDGMSHLSEEDALATLASAMLWPQVNIGQMQNEQKKPNGQCLFAPVSRWEHSYASARTVRQIAAFFFPQYSQFTEPFCPVYLAVHSIDVEALDIYIDVPQHAEPLAAFQDDTHALQYLLRAHSSGLVHRDKVTAEQQCILAKSDDEWMVYDAMMLTPREGYAFAKNGLATPANMALPSSIETPVDFSGADEFTRL